MKLIPPGNVSPRSSCMFSSPTAPKGSSLSERWRPSTLDGVVGQLDAVAKLRAFGTSWGKGSSRPATVAAILEGATGTGKTSAAYALAREMGWSIVEMNASDARNEGALAQTAGRAAITSSFGDDGRFLSPTLGERSLVLIDEVDALPLGSSRGGARSVKAPVTPFREFLHGRYKRIEDLNRAWKLTGKSAYDSFDELPKEPSAAGLARYPKEARMDIGDWQSSRKAAVSFGDEGAVDELARIVHTTRQPLLMTANDAYPLLRAANFPRNAVLRVKFLSVDSTSLRGHLLKVASAEGLTVSRELIDAIVSRDHGDVRAALNDLEALSSLPPGVDPAEVLGVREVESNLYEATRKFLSGGRFLPSVEVMRMVDVPPDQILPWIEENIPNFAEDADGLSEGFRVLASAEAHLALANRWRVWVLWSYASELMTGGVSTALFHGRPPGPYYRAPTVDFPAFFRGRGGDRRWVRDSLVRKLGSYVHMSRRRASSEMLPFVERLFSAVGSLDDSEMMAFQDLQSAFSKRLELESSEISYLLEEAREHPRTKGPTPKD